MAEPLRLGVLGAARIAPAALIHPALELGHEVVALASRGSGRGRLYADYFGVGRLYGDYAELLADPAVEVVYNALPNALHGPWNLAAVLAGKHVLSEKPFAATAAEAAAVRDAAGAVTVVEGFHYRHHPVFRRVLEVVAQGGVGEVLRVQARLVMPPPGAGDPRWSPGLAGGAMMDLGCYGLHIMRALGGAGLGAPSVAAATAARGPTGVDESMEVSLAFDGGAAGQVECSMAAAQGEFSLTVTGTRGAVRAFNVLQPHFDDRVSVGGRVEHLGRRPSYTYQLEALAAWLRGGVPLPFDIDDAVANMGLVDAAFHAAGLGLSAP